MNCARNSTLHPQLREDEALVVENAIRLAIDSIINVLYGVNSARTREYQRMVADRDKEIQRLERRLGETEHELQVFRRQGCASRQVKKEQSQVTGLQTSDDPQVVNESGLEPSSMDTEETAEQQECELSFSLDLLTRPLSHVSSQSHESVLQSSPSRLGLDQACTSHYSESSGISDAARNQTTSPSSSIMVKEEPCDIDDTVLIKWEMSEERIMGALESTSSLNQDKESPDGTKKLENRDRRSFLEKPHADSSGHSITEGENLRSVLSICDEIKAIIFWALPNLSEDTQSQIISSLQSVGVKSKEDLMYVEPEDINNLLPATQQRKLLKAFKKVTLHHQSPAVEPSRSSLSSPSPCFSPSSVCSLSQEATPSTSEVATPSVIIPITWPEHFKVPWHKMPEGVTSAIANRKRPAPEMRRIMVRVLVDEMRKYDTNPKRKECFVICRDLVKQYPSSFADMTPAGTIIGCGFTSLLTQVKRRIENINRGKFVERNRQTKKQSGRERKSADSYGCKHFQPGLPPEETDKTVEQKRQQLQNIYKQEGVQGGERAEVIKLMKITFCLQRNHINKSPTASFEDLRIQWPFLFTEKGIFCHFESLTDVNLLRALEESIEESGQVMEKYLRTKVKHRAQGAVPRNGELTFRITRLLLAYFDENTEDLILSTDLCASAADVEDTLTLPASPRLILLKPRDEVTVGRWMISIEGQVILESSQPSFTSGLAALFATYYVFNLQYQEEASKTLEFVQRRFVGINPEKGSKANHQRVLSKRTGKLVQKKAEIVSPPVASLIKNLMDSERGYM
ncbi:uncharacterized protein LOC141800652 isoform X3 [Halichoeres trimaculatus]|uniref:uncharacterized protein LOC141800652 isoform X3 n=1 Tax=Halichoeres trimaculatus TaxID=147232 RepID=UPI003D9EDDDC